jgi:hypothetical protein
MGAWPPEKKSCARFARPLCNQGLGVLFKPYRELKKVLYVLLLK